MSPRKTRRVAKADGVNETLSETISKKCKENSPPPSLRTIRTRGQLSKTIVQDSETDQSLDMNNTRRKTIQETPSGKSTRSRKRTVMENAGIIDDTSSALDVTATAKKRTRRAKDNEVLSEQTMIQHNSTINESLVEKPRATRTRKKATKKEDSKSEEEITEITSRKRRNSATTKVSPLMENVPMDGTNDVPMSKEDAEVQQASDRISRLKDSSVSRTSSPRSTVKRRARNARTRIEDFTPESSPITVNLSPHRSTKTPRKSPMNLGSPKSHADQSHRLTKTPRKLPVVAESPVGSDKSDDSSITGTPKSPKPSSGKKSRAVGSSEKKKKRQSKEKSPIKTPVKSPSKVVAVRKFSKSPKIVLRTPKAKTPKSKSPRVVTSSKAKVSPLTKRFSKTPTKSRQSRSLVETSESTSTQETRSPTISKRKTSRSRSPKKSATPTHSRKNSQATKNDSSDDKSPRINAIPISTDARTIDVNRSPTVVLNKLSDADVIGTPESTKRFSSRRLNASADDSSKITPITSPSVEKLVSHIGASPRRAKSAVKKRTPITDSGTPLRPVVSPRITSAKHSIGKPMIIPSSKSTPIEGRVASSGKVGGNAPMLSSTPRERIRRSLNLSPGLASTPVIIANSPINGPPVGSSTLIAADVRTTRSSRIEDVTNPLISEDDDSISLNAISRQSEPSCLDETFEVAKKTMLNVEEEEAEDKAGDGTYELIEPKTPTLRRKAAKRSLAEIDTSTEERVAKRTCRVRFASPTPNREDNKFAMRIAGRARSATPGQRVDERRVTPGNSNVNNGRKQSDTRRRSNSMTSVSLTKTPLSSIKRRSTSTSTANALSASKTAQNASVNRLSKPRLAIHQLNKKSEIKTPAAKKAPNFAQIHERKFAKMESLVDAKKRVEKRHLAINSQIPTSLSKVNIAPRTKPKISPKPATPSVPINGAYNRYGFKLRKNDAMKIVSQKQQPTHVSETKQNANRLLLKGVRTNRRFDLIMKARNINK